VLFVGRAETERAERAGGFTITSKVAVLVTAFSVYVTVIWVVPRVLSTAPSAGTVVYAETVWFEPVWQGAEDVKDLPPVRFNPDAYWWKIHVEQARAHARLGHGNYLPGLPDLVENIAILSALRGPQTCMYDMLDNPEWVENCVRDINTAWFEAFDILYDIAKGPDVGNAWGAFAIWGPGKTAKLQCDACAMFSPEMFERFVTPSLTEQCEWLDWSMYHLDGTQCICHLDNLLGIDALDAIEWTPQDGQEDGWHERWHPLYKKILDVGKSVQVVGVPREKIEYVLKSIGTKGVFIMTNFNKIEDIEETARIVDKWR
jgi:5-methyltetrahydrofolate--homocysteine methyltransferase